MRLSFGQDMRMAQKQVLAPRMIASMEILQLAQLALEERIEQEIQNNETLEVAEEHDTGTETPVVEQEIPPVTADERPLIVDQEHSNQADFERVDNWSNEYPDADEERGRVSVSKIEESSDRYLDAMANMEERPQTLSDHLHEQLALYGLTDEQRQSADKIIYNLDVNGYLPTPLEELLDPDGPKNQIALLKESLRLVQSMDPPGVGARDLRECLLLQIQDDLPYAAELRVLVGEHLENLGGNRLPLIERRTGYSLEKIEELRNQLHTLQPKPGSTFISKVVPVVKPDVHVEQMEDGLWRVRLEEINLPNLRISPYYRNLLISPETDPATREYIKRKINSAQWLIESIEQRRTTLLKTAQAIVDHQSHFLRDGPEAIEPLKMQQIADRVGVHVTTISRAVDEKWLQTPRGVFPLRKFFVGGTVSSDGAEVAWDTVRIKLQEVIDAEPKESPLSDDDLVTEMAKRGITVARRTVTKYRKAMDIPSSRQRRDWKLCRVQDSIVGGSEPSADKNAENRTDIPLESVEEEQ
ncbi:MAG: RNA polymerase factor sigma-54 [Planctomycetota bacterium]|jgi:RNA polymerase sigma-54 factor|nr:RNA polymerase factor sigma-54 [Planctomycetia bacterium]